jgi:hypothetical protein
MSRHGLSDDYDGDQDDLAYGRWRGRVVSAIRGQRGQAFLKEMLAALDAMPEKRLVAEDLETADGAVCALGAVGKVRGVDMKPIDPEDFGRVAATFGIAESMAQEIMYVNDEVRDAWLEASGPPHYPGQKVYARIAVTPEMRFEEVRAWVAKQIKT